MGIKKVGIVGAGLMGTSLATLFTGNGYETYLLDIDRDILNKAMETVRSYLDSMVEYELIGQDLADRSLRRLRLADSYSDLAELEFVFEAVSEKIEVKNVVLAALEEACSTETVLLSVTSGIMASILAESLQHKERFLVAHPWNPPHMIPLVEIVPSAHTSDLTLQKTTAMLESVGRKLVVVKKDVPGFIGNRIMHAMYREALDLLEQGVATLEDIDNTVLYGFGPRFSSVGLLEYYESCGLDLQLSVQSYLLADLCNATEPQQPLLECCERGDYGPKTGRGMFDWTKKDIDDFSYRKSKPFFRFVCWSDAQ
ncbi:MAG: 3-hydroxyacyl-CoA dehydrogenase family protein [Propionibacteriaceae bacterium]|nr:3-hydroxyacyl-CoA dehydrogenase family protein [Propionibacteriaceae bacterium]